MCSSASPSEITIIIHCESGHVRTAWPWCLIPQQWWVGGCAVRRTGGKARTLFSLDRDSSAGSMMLLKESDRKMTHHVWKGRIRLSKDMMPMLFPDNAKRSGVAYGWQIMVL